MGIRQEWRLSSAPVVIDSYPPNAEHGGTPACVRTASTRLRSEAPLDGGDHNGGHCQPHSYLLGEPTWVVTPSIIPVDVAGKQVRNNFEQAFAIAGGNEDELTGLMVQISRAITQRYRY